MPQLSAEENASSLDRMIAATADSPVVWVIPTNEELMIARHTLTWIGT